MIYFYKNQIFLLLGLIFLFSCGVEEKVKGKIDEIDEAYITVSGNLSHNDSSITVGIIFLLEGSVSLDLEKLSLELDNLELGQLIAKSVGKKLNYKMVDFHSSRPGHDLRYALSGDFMEKLGWVPKVSIEKRIDQVVKWTLENDRWLKV